MYIELTVWMLGCNNAVDLYRALMVKARDPILEMTGKFLVKIQLTLELSLAPASSTGSVALAAVPLVTLNIFFLHS